MTVLRTMINYLEKIFKATSDTVSSVITSLCNRVQTFGIFPDSLEIIVLRQIYKSGDDANLKCYRPISVLNCLSKISEKAAYTQMMEHLNKNNSLHVMQNFVDSVLTAFDENKFTISAFLDLSKAFDTVDHTILLKEKGILRDP